MAYRSLLLPGWVAHPEPNGASLSTSTSCTKRSRTLLYRSSDAVYTLVGSKMSILWVYYWQKHQSLSIKLNRMLSSCPLFFETFSFVYIFFVSVDTIFGFLVFLNAGSSHSCSMDFPWMSVPCMSHTGTIGSVLTLHGRDPVTHFLHLRWSPYSSFFSL